MTPSTNAAAVRETLEAHGQSHLLRFADELPSERRDALLAQIAELDLPLVARLWDELGAGGEEAGVPGDLGPAPLVDPLADADATASWREAGEALVRAGKVAAFTVAGGQGTRLGWNGPKGTYPATPLTGKPLFRVFAEQILRAQERFGATIPWYVMTSPINDADTRAFLEDNNCFGLERRQIFMFPQGVMPSLDARTGRILLAAPDRVAVNPDGHGGAFRALGASGALEDMVARGIEHISYFQVDNPSVRVVDPTFLGMHVAHPDSSGEFSSKAVRKTDPGEKVGVFCTSGGRTMVVEYSDLPAEHAEARADDGSLRFDGGSIAIHAIGVDFVRRLVGEDGGGLPFHRALKKVAHVDLDTGERVEPDAPNAVKLETFVFDALPRAERPIVCATDRVEEFAPIKNARGADSAATSHALQTERAARWLEVHGVRVPRRPDGAVDAVIEISPLTAGAPEELAPAELPAEIAPGREIVL